MAAAMLAASAAIVVEVSVATAAVPLPVMAITVALVFITAHRTVAIAMPDARKVTVKSAAIPRKAILWALAGQVAVKVLAVKPNRVARSAASVTRIVVVTVRHAMAGIVQAMRSGEATTAAGVNQ